MKLFLYYLALLCPAICLAQADIILSPAEVFTKARLQADVQERMAAINWNPAARTTSGTATLYTIPVVVHVLHDDGDELLTDSAVHSIIARANSYLLKKNADTAEIIDKYKPIAASTQIALRLAGTDPEGLPTNGIEYIRTYLTYRGDDYSRIHQWPQDKYLNIWLVHQWWAPYYYGATTTPYIAAYQPYYDGIVMPYTDAVAGARLAQMVGQFLNLSTPCYYFSCVDNDMIPDTPPCITGPYVCDLYDTTCDTGNAQNIMTSSLCQKMFTYGQGQYMQYVLQLDYGKRDSLVSSHNAVSTGIAAPQADLPARPDFSMSTHFAMPGQNVTFRNRSWNDTITNTLWHFSNGAAIPLTDMPGNVNNRFSQPGWVSVSLSATGNNTGTTTLTRPHTLYIADTAATPAGGYVQEFETTGSEMDKWPMFNYYDNGFKWQMGAAGYYSNSCIQYTGYDTRTFPQTATGAPMGDYDDLYTPVFDFTGVGGDCYLNFMSAGAMLASSADAMNDVLEISYSTNATYWRVLDSLKKDQLANMGSWSVPYVPAGPQDWAPHAIALPVAARTAHTVFRFRYLPGEDKAHPGPSTGNNFYLDHFNFGLYPAGVAGVGGSQAIRISPNPTSGSCTVHISGGGTGNVLLSVRDVTGHIVYHTTATMQQAVTIPAAAISVPGLYIVQVTTGQATHTEKLIVR